MQKFFQVGANLGYDKRGGREEAYVGCYTLHLLGGGGGGGELHKGGANAPPRPPLKYS